MAVNGFQYVRGGKKMYLSNVSSTATFRAGNPVSLCTIDRSLVESTSASSSIFGIAQANAADSLGGSLAGKCLVLVPEEDTVFEAAVETDGAAANFLAGQAYNIEKNGNYFRVDIDSSASARVILIPKGDGSVLDSANSTVFCQFLKDFQSPVGSNASVTIYM